MNADKREWKKQSSDCTIIHLRSSAFISGSKNPLKETI